MAGRLYRGIGGHIRECVGAQGCGPAPDYADRFSVSQAVVRDRLIMLETLDLTEVHKGYWELPEK